VDSRSLFALQNPAVFISSKLFRFVFDAVFTNGAFLGGYPDTLLRANKALAGTRFTLADILQSAASFLDELVVLKALEHNGSDLHRLIVHTEVSVLWILGAIMSRATEAKTFLKHQRRSLQAFIDLSNMKVEEQKSPLGADQHIVVLSARQMQQHFDFPDLPPIVNEPDSTDLYQRAITIALNHTGRMFDLGKTGNGDLALHITNLPRDTVLAAAMPAFISRAFNEISSGLVAEAADPRHAFCYEQLMHNQAVLGSSVYEGDGVDDFASPQISPQDMLSLMSWNVCFDHAYESSPAFLLMPIFTIVTSAYFVAPVCKENDEEALFRRRAEVDRAWSQLSVTTRQSWSSSTNAQTTDTKNTFKAPRRAMRSTRGIQLMQLALGLAQKLEDSCVTAACVLHLAMMLIYWCPHYALAMRMLERLDCECGDLLKHLPASVGPAFERNFIISCRAYVLIDSLSLLGQHIFDFRFVWVMLAVKRCRLFDNSNSTRWRVCARLFTSALSSRFPSVRFMYYNFFSLFLSLSLSSSFLFPFPTYICLDLHSF
jgi:predicted ester cyclase